MMIYIEIDERYPDRTIRLPNKRWKETGEYDIPEEKVREYQRIQKDYDRMQRELGGLIDEG